MKPSRGLGAVTAEALKQAERIFSTTSGGRPGASKILIVVTDDSSTSFQPIGEAVKPLATAGILVHVVAIGVRIPFKELQDMTPGDQNIHKVATPEEVPPKATIIADAIDEAIQESKLFTSVHCIFSYHKIISSSFMF